MSASTKKTSLNSFSPSSPILLYTHAYPLLCLPVHYLTGRPRQNKLVKGDGSLSCTSYMPRSVLGTKYTMVENTWFLQSLEVMFNTGAKEKKIRFEV